MAENGGQEPTSSAMTTTQPEAPKSDAITTRSAAVSNAIPFGMFGLQPTTFQEAMSVANMLASSTCIPKKFQGKPSDCLVMMEYAANLKVPVIQVMRFFMIVNDTPAIYGDLMLAVVINHPAYEWHKRYLRGEGESLEGVFEIKRRGQDAAIYSFSAKDAKTAGLGNVHKTFPKDMLQWRALSRGCRDKFADALCGLTSVEEAQDIAPSGPTIEGVEDAADPVDAMAPLRELALEIADFYKNKLITDSEGKRYNDARVAAMLGNCRSAVELQSAYDAGKAELARRAEVMAIPVTTPAAEIPCSGRATDGEPCALAVHPETVQHSVTGPYRNARPPVPEEKAAQPQTPPCKACERIKGKCYDCIQKEKEYRVQRFKDLLAQWEQVAGREPIGPPTLKQFEALGKVPQEQEIAKAETYLASVTDDAAPDQGKATLFS